MNIEYKIVTLTEKFYLDYPSDNYPEILEKSKRAYNCLMLELNDYYICIPYSKIARGANRFITDYIKIVRNNVDDKGLPKRFRFSTLQYFHKELSIL